MKLTIATPFYDEPIELLKRNVIASNKEIRSSGYDVEQIVVIDNPVFDESILKLVNFCPYLKFVQHTENKGLSAARNTALTTAKGEYFILLDTDDVIAPGRIKKQIEFMEKHNLIHSYGGYREIYGNNSKPEMGLSIIPSYFDRSHLEAGRNICYCGSNMIKTDALRVVGGFDENMKEGAEDFEMWIRLEDKGYSTQLLPEVLYYLGVHGNNMTAKLIENGGFTRAYQYIKEKYPHWKFTF